VDRKQERAFEEFVAEYGNDLLRLAALLMSDRGLGEDLYQETLHRLAARWSRVDSPRAYCRQVTPTRANQRYRALVTPGTVGRAWQRHDRLRGAATDLGRESHSQTGQNRT
jgi:DNA-directed RNA polymerase specialized sigma24 family protein